MARKRKGGGRQKLDLFQRAQRELSKGNCKAALKEAKVCFRQQASEPHRALLERAYAGRIEELHKTRHLDQARAALEELLQLGVSDPDIQDELPRWQVLLGGGSNGSAGSAAALQSRPELLVQLADQAILHAEQTSLPDRKLKEEAAAVRAALAAIEQASSEQGSEAALEPLSVIGRGSPLADWKLFARGLAAYYDDQHERARANWDRLDAGRPACRIAQTLLVASGKLRAADARLDVSAPLRKLEAGMPADAALGQLKILASYAKAEDWRKFFRVYRGFRQRHAASAPELIQRIVDVAWKQAVSEGREVDLQALMKIGPAPELDPHWRRALALLCDNRRRVFLDELEEHFVAYAGDLNEIAALSEDERRIGRALIHMRLGYEFSIAAMQARKRTVFAPWSRQDRGEDMHHAAVEHYRTAIKLLPDHAPSYTQLANLFSEFEETDSAASVFRELLRQDPDSLVAHTWLADHYLEQERPDLSDSHAAKVFEQRPRDPASMSLMWRQRMVMARVCAKRKMFTAAQQELDAAAPFEPRSIGPFVLPALRAAVDYKARNEEAGAKHVDDAVARAPEATVVWLLMSIHAARFSLAKEFKTDFNGRFESALKRKCNGQTAGALSRVLCLFVENDEHYPGHTKHQQLALAYLGRCMRVKWRQEDLRDVCQFLSNIGEQAGVWGKLLKKGLKQFPGDPCFHLWTADEITSGRASYRNFNQATDHLERALRLKDGLPSNLKDKLLDLAQSITARLERFERFGAFDMADPYGWDDDDYDEDDYDEDGYDEDGYDDDGFYDDEDDDDESFEGSFGPGSIDIEDLRELFSRTAPPDIKRALEELGVSMDDVFRRHFLNGEPVEEILGKASQSGRTQEGNKKRRKSRSKR